MTMDMKRIARHLMATRWRIKRAFPRDTLMAIDKAIKASEEMHRGEIRFKGQPVTFHTASRAQVSNGMLRDRRLFAVADMGYRTEQRRADLPAPLGP